MDGILISVSRGRYQGWFYELSHQIGCEKIVTGTTFVSMTLTKLAVRISVGVFDVKGG